ESRRFADAAAFASRTLATDYDSVSCLPFAQCFQRLGAVCHLSVQLEPGNDRNLTDDRRHRYRGHFRRVDWANGRALRRETDPLHWSVFWREWNGHGGVG